jgi:hypothetical protein
MLQCFEVDFQQGNFKILWLLPQTTRNFRGQRTKICATLGRFVSKRKALICSIPISKVKDMKRDVLLALKNSLKKVTLINIFFKEKNP